MRKVVLETNRDPQLRHKRRPNGQRLVDARVESIQDLPRPIHLQKKFPINGDVARVIARTRSDIGRILAGDDSRLLVVAGPCSIHDVSGAIEYARWLAEMADRFKDQLLVVMRVYCEKPRTRCGWKGFINDPYRDQSYQMGDGLRLARELLLKINGMKLPAATEFVDPITPQYTSDLISWVAIGARTVESQVHRGLASGLSCPVGFKNSTGGDIRVAVDAVVAARGPHRFLGVTKFGRACVVETHGNQDCHVVLRGGNTPNYKAPIIKAVASTLAAEGCQPRLMVDCSHGNCSGNYRNQLLVADDIARQIWRGVDSICGVMVESHLVEGTQREHRGTVSGRQSITDPCLGLSDTETLLDALASAKRRRDLHLKA